MNVLYWGHEEWTPIPYYRGQQFRDHWPLYGVTAAYLRYSDFLRAVEDWQPIEWADVVVFRRWYQDPTTPLAWAEAGRLGKARVYDTDDWDLGTSRKIPHRSLIAKHHDLIRQMAREADIVTVATPALVRHYASLSRRPPVVVRNAVDRSLYVNGSEPPDRPTAVFYGSRARLTDYFGETDQRGRHSGGYAHAAITNARLPVIWMGDEGVGETIPREFSRIVPFDRDLRNFTRALTETHAVVGLAPLAGDEFDACKSELHWLDYSAAGIPVVAQRMMGDSPYAVIRSGHDGFLARGHSEWVGSVQMLARNPSLRSEMVAAAQERLDREYDPAKRAGEWAEVFRRAVS